VYCEIFEGIHSQTGTYLETPAHFYGNDNCYLMSDVPVEKLVYIPCVVLNLPDLDVPTESRPAITAEMLAACTGTDAIQPGDAILVGTGWGKYWMESCYLDASPYFTYDAMQWLVEKKPFLLGTDFPRWESFEHPQNLFPLFYAADILMLAPLVNLECISANRVKLTALQLKIPGTSCVPCRAVVTEE
jgi:kynurenine formamidase